MLSKCYNKDNISYDKFGEVGVTVCDLWRNSIKDFYSWAIRNGFKISHSVFLKKDENVFGPDTSFIESKADATKRINSKLFTHNGKTQSITDWAKDLGCSQSHMSARIKKYPPEKAFDLTSKLSESSNV